MRHARFLRIVLSAALLTLAPVAASADDGEALRARLDAVAPSIAVVKFTHVMRWTSGGVPGESETPMDVRAAVVDPSGILVLQGQAVGGETEEQRAWVKANAGAQLKTTAESMRVILPPDATEHPAAVLLLDARLGLAFVQVLDLGQTRLPAIDLAQGAAPRLGETLVGVTRDYEGYGHAAIVTTLYAAGRLEKPATAWLAAGDFSGQRGLPVFALAGKPCGVVSQQSAAEGTDDGSVRSVILPLEAVLKSLDAARKKVPEVLARVASERKAAEAKSGAKEEGKEPAKESEKPPAPKDPAAPEKPGSAEAPPLPGQPR